MFLKARNKLGFIDGSIEQPKKDPLLGQWERCDSMVSAWIIHSVNKDIASNVLYCNSIAEI